MAVKGKRTQITALGNPNEGYTKGPRGITVTRYRTGSRAVYIDHVDRIIFNCNGPSPGAVNP